MKETGFVCSLNTKTDLVSVYNMVTPVEIVGLVHIGITSLISITTSLKCQANGFNDVVLLLESAEVKLVRVKWSLEAINDLSGLKK